MHLGKFTVFVWQAPDSTYSLELYNVHGDVRFCKAGMSLRTAKINAALIAQKLIKHGLKTEVRLRYFS